MSAMTAAERAKEYRRRKRDAGNVSASEPARHERHENVTKQERDAPGVSSRKKQTFADLPADVQASIETNCAENNNGERAASHSRQAMTERALKYQEQFPDPLTHDDLVDALSYILDFVFPARQTKVKRTKSHRYLY